MRTWAVELLGTLLLVVAYLWTRANPYILGITYAAALFIAGPISGGNFSPLVTGAQWALGRLDSEVAVQYMLAQVAGAALAVVATPVLQIDGTPTQ